MSDVKAKVIREVRPREAAMIGCYRGSAHASLDQVAQLSGELAAAKAVIKEQAETIRRLKDPKAE